MATSPQFENIFHISNNSLQQQQQQQLGYTMKVITKKSVKTIAEVKSMLETSMDYTIQESILFRIVSDAKFREFGILKVCDGNSKADKCELEFDPQVQKSMESLGKKMLFPGCLYVAKFTKIIRNRWSIVPNSHLELLRDSQLEFFDVDAHKFSKIAVDEARTDIKLKDLVKMTKSSGLSENIWVKVCNKLNYKASTGQDCMNIKLADETEKITLKLWKPAHVTMLSNIEQGDYIRFRNLQLKVQEREGGPADTFLQYLPKYTIFEKIDPQEAATFPDIPDIYELGDEEFKGQVIGLEGFQWLHYCHQCPFPNKTSNCKVHTHGRDVDLVSYKIKMVAYGEKDKKEFHVFKKEIEEFRDQDLTLDEDMDEDDQDLGKHFEQLMDKPVRVIYNISTKTGDLWLQKISIIPTIKNTNNNAPPAGATGGGATGGGATRGAATGETGGGDKQAKSKKKQKKRVLLEQQQQHQHQHHQQQQQQVEEEEEEEGYEPEEKKIKYVNEE